MADAHSHTIALEGCVCVTAGQYGKQDGARTRSSSMRGVGDKLKHYWAQVSGRRASLSCRKHAGIGEATQPCQRSKPPFLLAGAGGRGAAGGRGGGEGEMRMGHSAVAVVGEVKRHRMIGSSTLYPASSRYTGKPGCVYGQVKW